MTAIPQELKGSIVFSIQLLALALADDDMSGVVLAQRTLAAAFPTVEVAHETTT